MKGILLVDKPVGCTSHDVVDMIRRAAGIRRVGHTGTLDPNATGLLILCLGQATRLSEFLIGLDKVYEGAMLLGTVTDTQDIEGEVLEENEVPDTITEEQIKEIFQGFTGEIQQVPPMVSAVKSGGSRLYSLARKGETVDRPARTVTVHEFELLRFEPPKVYFRIRCTRGTYARTLAHDVGQELGCGGTLAELRRTWVGHHSLENAQPADAFQTREDVKRHLLPVDDALNLPIVVVRRGSERLVANGGTLGPGDIEASPEETGGTWVQIKNADGKLLAVGQAGGVPAAPLIQPKRVIGGRS